MFCYHSCKSWHPCMACIYNGKRFLRLHRGGGGFHSPCILAIFIRRSGVGFCLSRYHDMMCFNVAMITIRKFPLASSAPKRKPISTPHPPKEIFLVCKGTHFQNSPFSQGKYRWMRPFFSDDNCSLTSVESLLDAGGGQGWDLLLLESLPRRALRRGPAARVSLQSPSLISLCSSRARLRTADWAVLLLIKKIILKYSWTLDHQDSLRRRSLWSRVAALHVKIGRV